MTQFFRFLLLREKMSHFDLKKIQLLAEQKFDPNLGQND